MSKLKHHKNWLIILYSDLAYQCIYLKHANTHYYLFRMILSVHIQIYKKLMVFVIRKHAWQSGRLCVFDFSFACAHKTWMYTYWKVSRYFSILHNFSRLSFTVLEIILLVDTVSQNISLNLTASTLLTISGCNKW